MTKIEYKIEKYPKAWQGAFQTGRYSPALCAYKLLFRHASFGNTSSLNDLNISNLSPLLDSLLDGSFTKTEEEANIASFQIGDDPFNQLFVFVNDIYPKYSGFVK
jgi:Plant transposon protein